MAAYLTPDEFRAAPTGIDTTNLAPDPANAASQTAQLARVIDRAGGWIRRYCDQHLYATSETETRRTRLTPHGELAIHPDMNPIIAFQSVYMGNLVSSLTLLDMTNSYIERETFVIQSGQYATSSQGPLTIASARPGGQALIRYTYTHGWPSTTLTSAPAVGATSFTVADLAGVVAGTQYTIADPLAASGDLTETVTVTSVVASTSTVNCTPTVNAHKVGVGFSNLPADVKEAAILMVSAIIKLRGDSSYSMTNSMNPGEPIGMDRVSRTDWLTAQDILRPYKRVR